MIVRTRVIRPTPWLFERTTTALMVGGLLLLLLVVGLGIA